MSDEEHVSTSKADAELQREVLEGREFSLEEAIARMAGPGAMKGESPVARMRQAEIEIETWLGDQLPDAGGALKAVLLRQIKGGELLLAGFEQPLTVLAAHCQRVLDSAYLLKELVRQVDVEWGRAMGERPHFQRADGSCDPDDPYTVDSVRNALSNLVRQLAGGDAPPA
jgi:hypothetical protein